MDSFHLDDFVANPPPELLAIRDEPDQRRRLEMMAETGFMNAQALLLQYHGSLPEVPAFPTRTTQLISMDATVLDRAVDLDPVYEADAHRYGEQMVRAALLKEGTQYLLARTALLRSGESLEGSSFEELFTDARWCVDLTMSHTDRRDFFVELTESMRQSMGWEAFNQASDEVLRHNRAYNEYIIQMGQDLASCNLPEPLRTHVSAQSQYDSVEQMFWMAHAAKTSFDHDLSYTMKFKRIQPYSALCTEYAAAAKQFVEAMLARRDDMRRAVETVVDSRVAN